MSHKAVIGLGSNIEPETHLKQAVGELGRLFTILKQSTWVSTEPIGIADQPGFINGTILMKTSLEQEKVKDILRIIEDKLGRDRSLPKFGPRVIDLDIVVWNGKIIDEDYFERDFLRKSIIELIPGFNSKQKP